MEKSGKNSGMLDVGKIKALRQSRGLTMEAAAAAAGLGSRQAWYHIESGAKTNLELATLAKLAGALGVHSRDLLR